MIFGATFAFLFPGSSLTIDLDWGDNATTPDVQITKNHLESWPDGQIENNTFIYVVSGTAYLFRDTYSNTPVTKGTIKATSFLKPWFCKVIFIAGVDTNVTITITQVLEGVTRVYTVIAIHLVTFKRVIREELTLECPSVAFVEGSGSAEVQTCSHHVSFKCVWHRKIG